ncbi:hypothetical protein B0H16DRAFT_1739291 [Mycena metata]|uniref:Uncharacterized protein n=1 Tax=Mycena metata TaxID=1033252 RepID=A0AAD7HGF8_9AGAR|nr:hypothetical protein B0H16DRAFT_1739291 [Mycena metata]
MAAGLLCSNHVTYRFGKGMMPKAYRLSREAMAVIMEQYASAQMPPTPFSPNPTPAASASDLNLAGPRPHHDEDGEGEGGIRMGMAASRRATSEGVGGNMRSTSHWILGRRGGGSEVFFFFCVVGLHRGRGAGVVVRLKSRGIALG